MRDTLLLMKKNLKQDLRRPKGFTCEMLCPVSVFLLFALLRSTIDKKEIPINYADDTFGGKVFVEYDYKDINTTHRAYQDIARLICLIPDEWSDNGAFYPASYLAIVPPPTSHNNVQYIIDEMYLQWNISKSVWNPNNCVEAGATATYAGCRSDCKYDELNFSDESILKFFDSEAELTQYLSNDNYASSSWDPTEAGDGTRPIGFAIIFDEYADWNSITYTLRGNASYFPTTEGETVNKFEKGFEALYYDGYFRYYSHGMVHIQQWLNQIITQKIAIQNAVHQPSFQYGIFAMPTAGYLTDGFYRVLSGMLPFMMILAFIYPYFVISGAVVQEKASKIKEGLRMMGASTISYWLSIYLYYGIKFVIISFLCTFISAFTKVFEFSQFTVIFLWFTLFLFTLLTSAILFSTFFDNPKTASMVSSIFLLTLYFMSAAAESMNKPSHKTWLCLSGPACFAMSSNNFAKYEEGLIGLKWHNIDESYEYLKFSTAIVMMFVDCIIYIILAMYLDRVVPSKYGQRLPLYFIFQKSYWCKNTNYRIHQEDAENEPILTSKKYEPMVKQKAPSIQIRNLKKVFSSGLNSDPVVAVSGISLDIYENEIFCLLGHNGAGKTTTISMLTGMLNITSGSAKINGKDIVSQMSQIRESLGVCPQHDVLYHSLTVEEHLELFAQLKGVPSSNIKGEVNTMIDAVKMQDKRDKYPTQMSGGQKRKLSLAIALIGNSKIVFLDEPTSGMDPHSRRDAWELIKASSKGRTIILTTHFMDEADLLSDRIAIMAKGAIECCGSSLFLKRLYGVGYSFTISVNTQIPIHTVRQDIDTLIMDEINTAQLLSTHGSELIYRLPFESSKSFPSMFRLMDQQKQDLHIDSYGISVTTLEEVFIKVGHGHQPTEEKSDKHILQERRESIEMKPLEQRRESIDSSDNLSEIRRRSHKSLFFVHILAMLHKKVHYTKRDKRAMLCQMFLPILFMIFGFAIIDFEEPSVYPRLKLDMSHFGQDSHQIPYNSESIPSINPFPVLLNGSLLSLNGGDNGIAYEYVVDDNIAMHTYFDSMLAVSDQEPFKYVSYYFPIYNSSINNFVVDPTRHIGVGANVSAYHSLPITINMASNLALKSVSNTSEINAYIQPLPTTKQQTAATKQYEAMIYSTYLSFGFAFFPVGIMYSIVYEKENMCKSQLLISGMNSVAYWLGNYIFDIITILPSSLSAIVLIYAFDATSFTGEAMVPFVLIVLLYGLSIVPFTYLFSWCFKTSTRAQYIALISFIFLGYGFSLATFILDISASTRDYSSTIKSIVRFSPSYCAAAAMLNLATRDLPFAGLWEVNDPPFEWAITGQLITYMACESVIYFVLNLLVEYLSTIPEVNALLGLVTNVPKQPMDLDQDIQREQDKLKQFLKPDQDEFDFKQCRDPIIIAGLRKVYNTGSIISSILNGCNAAPDKTVTAVKDLWYSVPCGQIFGFLGVNGAGKTTTLSMLCGKHTASEGIAYINRVPITNQIACRRMIGFCPQFDAIFDLLTAREHLTIYGMIKGLNKQYVEEQADDLMNKLSLSEYADKRAGTYSGGNKRKLSVALAMIGSPPIVFLDEPSTGMDPVSRRIMWDFISQSMHGRSVILTTHSMEECEALCHRIGIMVKGQLRCLGTSQRLKQRYGKGFQLDANINVNKQQKLTNELNVEFNDFSVEIVEQHDENIQYIICGVQGALSLADMFEKLEKINEKINIDGGYALNQTTLEQIFIQMASQYQDQ